MLVDVWVYVSACEPTVALVAAVVAVSLGMRALYLAVSHSTSLPNQALSAQTLRLSDHLLSTAIPTPVGSHAPA